MNTRVEYLYRDASNYKQWHDVVLEGEIDELDIRGCLWESEYFIPSLVGLPDLQEKFGLQGFAVPNEDDHPWHEIERVRLTDTATTVDITAERFLGGLRNCSKVGWEKYALMTEEKLHDTATLDT